MDNMTDTLQLDHNTAPRVFKPGQYVVIRIEMTAGDDIAIKNALAEVKGQGKGATMKMLLGDAQLATMRAMIVGWGGIARRMADPQGNIKDVVIPFAPENVKLLPKAIWDYVYNKINELNPDMDESEQTDFLALSNGRSGESSSPENLHLMK